MTKVSSLFAPDPSLTPTSDIKKEISQWESFTGCIDLFKKNVQIYLTRFSHNYWTQYGQQ